MRVLRKFETILFDLDGTLLDTAPDLLEALNFVLKKEGWPVVYLENYRDHMSIGATKLIKLATKNKFDGLKLQSLTEDFLNYYEANLCVFSQPFVGITKVLNAIENRGIKWGIVTNKQSRFTSRLINSIKWTSRCQCVVSGDTLQLAKPHPEPLLYAAKQLDTSPQSCLYVGDAATDCQAAKAAGMEFLLARYGYLPFTLNTKSWTKIGEVENAEDIINWID